MPLILIHGSRTDPIEIRFHWGLDVPASPVDQRPCLIVDRHGMSAFSGFGTFSRAISPQWELKVATDQRSLGRATN